MAGRTWLHGFTCSVGVVRAGRLTTRGGVEVAAEAGNKVGEEEEAQGEE